MEAVVVLLHIGTPLSLPVLDKVSSLKDTSLANRAKGAMDEIRERR
jgi:hypothetical protein